MKELIDLLHLLTCPLPHAHNPEDILNRREGICYYWIEDGMAEGLELPDHILWEDRAEKFKFSMGFTTNEATLAFIRDCIELNHQVSKITCGIEGRRSFIKMTLDL